MGIVGLWPLLKKKGYEPAFRSHVPLVRSTSEAAAVCRLDIQGTFYMNIRSAYIRHPAEIAHQIMEQQISKMVPKDRTVLYLDGAPAKEKESTHAQRRQTRQDSATDAEKLLVQLRDRIQKGESVRKWMFNAIKKATEKVFYWSAESRVEFAQYLEQNGWQVQVAPTEADLAIARDCGPADIVISKDSDMAIYTTVHRICRPISGGRFLDYILQDAVEALGLTRQQLCVLGIVSRNDYNRNIPSLGSATNFKLVKEIVDTGKHEDNFTHVVPIGYNTMLTLCNVHFLDPATMVEDYLALDQVVLKNTTNESFQNARRVFVDLVQEPVEPSQVASDQVYKELSNNLEDLCVQYAQSKSERPRPASTRYEINCLTLN